MITARTQIARAWDLAWFRPTSPVALGAFRIALGLLWLEILVVSLPNWLRFYGREGIVPFAWLGEPFFARPSILSLSSAEVWTWACYAVALIACICFTFGYKTRIATIVLYLMVISMVNRTPTVTHGEDLVSRPLLFFACFASLGDRWSVDDWLRRRSGAPRPPQREVWPLRLMQISVVFVYLFSLPAKPSDDIAWIDGSAIYYVMASENWGRFPELAPLFYAGPLSPLMTWGTLVIEGLFPFLVWPRRTRPYALGALALLQLGIALLVGHVLNFNLVMLASFLLFVPDSTLEMAVARVRIWVRSLVPAERVRTARA